VSIWSSIPPTHQPDILDDIPDRDQYGRPYDYPPIDGDTRYVEVATSGQSTVCRLSLDGDHVFLSADEVAELILRLHDALSNLTAAQ